MDQEKYVELKANSMANNFLIIQLGAVLMDLLAEKSGYEAVQKRLEKWDADASEAFANNFADTDEAQQAARLVDRQVGSTYQAIRKQIELIQQANDTSG